MFTLTIETDNAAFEEAGTTSEVARILRRLAEELESPYLHGAASAGDPVRDINGNTVGRWELG